MKAQNLAEWNANATGEKKVIAFNVSGHGFMDIQGYREVLGIV
jgi:predicted alternative tryptophan synthase beta-subunit